MWWKGNFRQEELSVLQRKFRPWECSVCSVRVAPRIPELPGKEPLEGVEYLRRQRPSKCGSSLPFREREIAVPCGGILSSFNVLDTALG